MSLDLFFHPFASFCQKALIAFYENDTPYEPHIVDLGDEGQRAAFLALWPIGKFPVVRDGRLGLTLPESTIIIEHLDLHYGGATRFVPADGDAALQVRLGDRFYDHYVQEPMQKIVGDRNRPPGAKDPHGVTQARAILQTAYGLIEHRMAARTWNMGESFTLADCAAAPALRYAAMVEPFEKTHPATAAYLRRLSDRPSFARVLDEAAPYAHFFPKG